MIGGRGLSSVGSKQGPVTGCCEHGNEHSGSIKGGECLDWVTNGFSGRNLRWPGHLSRECIQNFGTEVSLETWTWIT